MSSAAEKKTDKTHRIPEHSVFYGRVIPALFVLLAIVMLLLIIFALGVLTGVIAWA